MKYFKKDSLENNESYVKINYWPIYLSFIGIFVALAILSFTTYAWFSSSAYLGGSSIGAGNLYIDLLADNDYLDAVDYNGDRTSFATYSRKNNGVQEDYYIITNSDVPIINLKNVEPGQLYPVKFNVLNTGELAVKFSAAFNYQIDQDGNILSYTGLETISKELANYPENEELLKISEILNKIQRDNEGNDKGGHLEDILEVYIGSDSNDIDEQHYIGKLSEVLNGDIGAYTGYLLPKNKVIDDGGNVNYQDVEIRDENNNLIKTIESVCEMGELNYLIYLPTDADNLYQYASITFSLGATASQVEYEYDGTNYMLYDSFDWVDEGEEFDDRECIITKMPFFISDNAEYNGVIATSSIDDLGTCSKGLIYFYITETTTDLGDGFVPPNPKDNIENWYTYEQISYGGEFNSKNITTRGHYYSAYCCAYDINDPDCIPSDIVFLGKKHVENSR